MSYYHIKEESTKYICIKNFPNTTLTIGEVVNVRKTHGNMVVIDDIETTREVLNEHFKPRGNYTHGENK